MPTKTSRGVAHKLLKNACDHQDSTKTPRQSRQGVSKALRLSGAYQALGTITISTRRFWARPSGVRFDAIG